MIYSSVAFAVPEYSLKEKDLRKRLHFLFSLILAKISALAKSLWKSTKKKTSCQNFIIITAYKISHAPQKKCLAGTWLILVFINSYL